MRTSFEAIASQYGRFTRSEHHLRAWRGLMDMIFSALPQGAQILDVGCGSGAFSIPLAQAGFRVTALDFAPGMLQAVASRAAQERVELQTVQADLTQPLELAERFDAALSVHGPLNYHRDPLPMLRNIADVLKPNGRVWLGLHRAASARQVLRKPWRALRPLAAGVTSVRGVLEGAPITVYLHDPPVLIRRLRQDFQIEKVRACGLLLRGPTEWDATLGTLPGLRRLGSTTLLQASKR